MNARIQRLCVWCGPVFLILYIAAFYASGYLPPQPPTMSVSAIADFYHTHPYQIRIGQIACLVLSTLLFPWFALISTHMARVEGRFPVLALMQFGGGVLLVVFFQICSMLWLIATYRTDLDPMVLRLLHESSWLIFVMVFPSYTLQMFCIAAAGFMDKSERPWLPRWACFFNMWEGITATGGGLAVFFKTGPFAWNGLIGFWIPVFMFALWLLIMTPLLLSSIERHSATQSA